MEQTEYRKKFLAAAARQGWLESPGVVCALSGGGDSVALLWMLKNFYKGKIVAAHLDHCTRNGASHEDVHFVKELCRVWKIECAVRVIDVYSNRKTGESFEMAGRRLRYDYFRETAAHFGLKFIAVGHNADDVVETQLLNLARGSGLAGLRGIPEVHEDIVRPVIDFSRDELRSILRSNNVPWRDDYTNYESDYKRNKVRNILIPWIKENLNPGFTNVMLGLSKQVIAEVDIREAEVRREIEKIAITLPPAIVAWRTEGLSELPPLILSEMLRYQGAELSLTALSRSRTDELTALVRRGGFWRFQWVRDIEVCYSRRAMGWLHRADIPLKRKSSKNTLPWWAR